MTDGEKTMYTDAYNLVNAAAHKVKVGSDMWIQFVSMAMAFGLVLDIPGYREKCRELLAELQRLLSPPVTDVGVSPTPHGK